MKKLIHIGLALSLILIINTSISAQNLGSFDLLTNPISWSQDKANIGGQVFLHPKFALYGALEQEDYSFNIAQYTGQYDRKQLNGSLRFYPFGIREVNLFHPAHGPKSKSMKRKYKKKYGCEATQGFINNNPFSFLKGLFFGMGLQNEKESYYNITAEELSNDENFEINGKKLTGTIGYHFRVENISFNIHYQATYGKNRADVSNSLAEYVFEDVQSPMLNEFDHTWQIQVGLNF